MWYLFRADKIAQQDYVTGLNKHPCDPNQHPCDPNLEGR